MVHFPLAGRFLKTTRSKIAAALRAWQDGPSFEPYESPFHDGRSPPPDRQLNDAPSLALGRDTGKTVQRSNTRL